MNFSQDRKELTFSNELKKDSTYTMGKAMVRFNMEDAVIDNVKIGDHADRGTRSASREAQCDSQKLFHVVQGRIGTRQPPDNIKHAEHSTCIRRSERYIEERYAAFASW